MIATINRVVLALYYVFHAALEKMHRVLTVLQKLPSSGAT